MLHVSECSKLGRPGLLRSEISAERQGRVLSTRKEFPSASCGRRHPNYAKVAGNAVSREAGNVRGDEASSI